MEVLEKDEDEEEGEEAVALEDLEDLEDLEGLEESLAVALIASRLRAICLLQRHMKPRRALTNLYSDPQRLHIFVLAGAGAITLRGALGEGAVRRPLVAGDLVVLGAGCRVGCCCVLGEIVRGLTAWLNAAPEEL